MPVPFLNPRDHHMKRPLVQPRTPRLPVVPRFIAAADLAQVASCVCDLPDSYWTPEFYSDQVGRLLGHIAALELLTAAESLPRRQEPVGRRT